jgi:hypothetical protein
MSGTGLPAPPSSYSGSGNSNGYGINPSSPTYANDTFAAVTQDQWSNYVNTFVPIENQLIKYATDPTQPAQAMATAQTDVDNSFSQQAGATQRQNAALGVTPTADETAATTKATGLTKSLAGVQAQNTARDLTVQRQQGILGNPAPQGV